MIQMDVFYVFNRMFSKGHAIYKARTKSQVATITYLGGVYSAGDLLTIFSSRVELIRGGGNFRIYGIDCFIHLLLY